MASQSNTFSASNGDALTLRDAALRYAEAGWPVFPVRRDKRPLTAHGFHDATTDEAQVREWWRRWRNASIGYPTGTLVVVEIDGPVGLATRREQEAHGLDWPVTLTSLSGRADGGAHFWFAAPEGVEIRNAAGVRGSRGIGPGIDVRGRGGYVVLPPSLHPSGRAYQWTVRMEPSPLPAWMQARLKPPPPMRPIVPRGDTSAYGRAALQRACEEVESAPEGGLNDQLNRSAFILGRVVAAGALSEGEVREALLVAAMRAGHPERGARRTIESGLSAGLRQADRI